MDINVVRTALVEGGNLIFKLVSMTRKPPEVTIEAESPEEAFNRIYGQLPTPGERLKLKTAQKAMEAVEKEIKKASVGTACIPCGYHHITTSAAALGEALRFARKDGINSPEVIRRFEIATEECDIAERIDFAPTEVEKASANEKEFLREFIPKMRDYRHQSDQISTIDDLERVAALGQNLAAVYRAKASELMREKK